MAELKAVSLPEIDLVESFERVGAAPMIRTRPMDDSEKVIVASMMIQAVEGINSLQEERKAINDQFKKSISTLEQRYDDLVTDFKASTKEYRTEVIVYRDGDIEYLVDPSTREVVKTRKPKENPEQQELFGKEYRLVSILNARRESWQAENLVDGVYMPFGVIQKCAQNSYVAYRIDDYCDVDTDIALGSYNALDEALDSLIAVLREEEMGDEKLVDTRAKELYKRGQPMVHLVKGVAGEYLHLSFPDGQKAEAGYINAQGPDGPYTAYGWLDVGSTAKRLGVYDSKTDAVGKVVAWYMERNDE